MNLRQIDLGLVEDKIERAVREACNQYLLLDVKTRRILLVLPSVLPHQLLSSILTTIFVNLQNPSITLFSTPTALAVAAGCRSSLVVDIGWSETTITAIYEYREVHQSRTTRAMKRVTVEMVKMLRKHTQQTSPKDNKTDDEEEDMLEADFEVAEDITTRMAWCPNLQESQRMAQQQQEDRSTTTSNPSSPPLSQALSHLTIASDVHSPPPPPPVDPQITVPSPFPSPSSKTPGTITLPFTLFTHPTESALLASQLPRHTSDDHEQPLPSLIYRTLLSLSPDVRAVCMSHIIITGGGSHIPGLKPRLLEELSATVQSRGWDAVEGRAAARAVERKKLGAVSGNQGTATTTNAKEENLEQEKEKEKKAAAKTETLPPSHQTHPPDPIAEKLHRAANRGTKPIVSGVVRGVESLGAWAGGSLMASLRIKGVVEVDRDVFLATGLAGARRDGDVQRGGGVKGGGLEVGKGGWTLGGWA